MLLCLKIPQFWWLYLTCLFLSVLLSHTPFPLATLSLLTALRVSLLIPSPLKKQWRCPGGRLGYKDLGTCRELTCRLLSASVAQFCSRDLFAQHAYSVLLSATFRSSSFSKSELFFQTKQLFQTIPANVIFLPCGSCRATTMKLIYQWQLNVFFFGSGLLTSYLCFLQSSCELPENRNCFLCVSIDPDSNGHNFNVSLQPCTVSPWPDLFEAVLMGTSFFNSYSSLFCFVFAVQLTYSLFFFF